MRPNRETPAGDGPPSVAMRDQDEQMMATAIEARTQAAAARAWAHERLAWIRVVQEQTWDVAEHAAAAQHQAEAARARALRVYIAAMDAWAFGEEVRTRAEAASERARALSRPAS